MGKRSKGKNGKRSRSKKGTKGAPVIQRVPTLVALAEANVPKRWNGKRHVKRNKNDNTVKRLSELLDREVFLQKKYQRPIYRYSLNDPRRYEITEVYTVIRPRQPTINGKGCFGLVRLWHGTADTNLCSIIQDGGLKPGFSGLLGAGIYLGERPKAENFARGKHRILLSCNVALGKTLNIVNGEILKRLRANGIPDEFDSAKGIAGVTPAGWRLNTTLINNEWIVRHGNQVSILSIHVTYEKEVQTK